MHLKVSLRVATDGRCRIKFSIREAAGALRSQLVPLFVLVLEHELVRG